MKTNPSIRIISGSNKGFKINFRPSSKLRPVDHTKDQIHKINKLTAELNHKDKCECIRADVSAWMHSNEQVFDLIFMDPPYEFKDYEILLKTIALNKMLSKNGFIFLEHAARISINIPDTLKAIREKKVGEAKGLLIQWK